MMLRARPVMQACPVFIEVGIRYQYQVARLQLRRKCSVESKGNDDKEGVPIFDQEEQTNGDSLSPNRGSGLSLLRTRFIEALAALAASRLQANDAAQEELQPNLLSARIESSENGDYQPALIEQDNVDDANHAKLELTSPGFSFSAAGLLFPYHLGVGQCLIENGYITEKTPLSGSSAGALVCAVIASGLSMEDAMRYTKELASDCRKNGTAFRLGVVLRRSLESCLPEDAHVRLSGKIRVAITQVFRTPRALLVDSFVSKNDLIDALIASCFVPGYLAPRPAILYRNRICVDGGLTSFMPPTASQTTVRVCAFPAAQFGLMNVEISPDCNPTSCRASPRQLLSWALEAATDDILENLFDLGYQDALVWVNKYQAKVAAPARNA